MVIDCIDEVGDDKLVSLHKAVAPVKVGYPQSTGPQCLADARPRQQNHLSSSDRQAAAGVAADAAGAGNDDRLVLFGHPVIPL